jgi:hypothetical protein
MLGRSPEPWEPVGTCGSAVPGASFVPWFHDGRGGELAAGRPLFPGRFYPAALEGWDSIHHDAGQLLQRFGVFGAGAFYHLGW